MQRQEKTGFEQKLADDELRLAKIRHEIAELESVAMFGGRLRTLEDEVTQLRKRFEPEEVPSEDPHGIQRREKTRVLAETLMISWDVAALLLDEGYQTPADVAAIDDRNARSIESKFPAIRKMISRARESLETPPPESAKPYQGFGGK